ncbi:MAG: SemiSWEET family sugar transporter [Vicinamibacterales bacterium]
MPPAVPPFAIDLIGYAAAACTTASWIPQVVRTWRSRSADDLSPAMLTAFSTGVLLWLVFGLAMGSGPIIAANAVTLALNLLLLVLRMRFGGRGRA